MSIEVSNVCKTVWPNGGVPLLEAKTLSKSRYWWQCLLMAAASVVLFFVFEHKLLGAVIGALSLLLLFGILFSKPVLNGFDLFARLLVRGVGVGLTWFLLIPVFYLVFGFGRLVLIISRKDPMNRRFDSKLGSYWLMASAGNAKHNHQKQY